MIEVRVPDEQEGTKAVVRAWLKRIGDAVAENDPLVELETDKVTQEVPAPAAGVLTQIVLDTDAEAVPGALLAIIDPAAQSGAAQSVGQVEATHPELRVPPARSTGGTETRLSPSVRRACQQHNIDPSRLQGTGRGGRITREDVDRAVAGAAFVTAGEPAS